MPTSATQKARAFGTHRTGGLWGLGKGTGVPTYGLDWRPTSGPTAGASWICQDLVPTTGKTTFVLAKGAVAGNIFEIRSNNLATLYASITDLGVIDAASYKVGGVAGVSFGPGMPTSMTFVNGLLTAAS